MKRNLPKNLAYSYTLARERYAALGVNVDAALAKLARIPISLHCWQRDDVGGFENTGGSWGGGLAVTGNYPGKARTADELRAAGAVICYLFVVGEIKRVHLKKALLRPATATAAA